MQLPNKIKQAENKLAGKCQFCGTDDRHTDGCPNQDLEQELRILMAEAIKEEIDTAILDSILEATKEIADKLYKK